MRSLWSVLTVVCAFGLLLTPLGGCPTFSGSGGLDWLFEGGDSGGDVVGTTGPGGTGTTGGDTGGTGTGGGTGSDGGSGGDTGSGGGAATLDVVKTGISVRHDADIEAGDDLIAFGTDSMTGVSYIEPSGNPTSGTAVPDSELYDSSAFAVGGRTIFLAGSNTGSLAYQVSVFDVDAAVITKTFTAEEIRLNSIPVGAEDPGNIQADGDYCVVVCDPSSVTDEKIIKVIDVSGDEPALVAMDVDPIDYANGVQQVAVDAETKTVVVAADGTFYVYDIDNPTAEPTAIASPNGIGDVQMKMHGGYVIAVDDQSYPQVILVDISGEQILTPTDGLAAFDVAIGEDLYSFYADYDSDDSSGGHQRTAVATLPQTAYTKVSLDNYIDGSTTNNGLVGFGATMTIPPSGGYVFLADWYLQYSTGDTSFVVPDDPEGVDSWGCPAWDVDSSDDVVAFKTSSNRSDNTTTTVGYVLLP